jgi:SH3-like domain-containing protein
MEMTNTHFSLKKKTKVSAALLTILSILLVLYTDASAAQRLSVGVNVANVRSGPGKNYETLWQVEKYHPIVVIESQGAWYKFRDFEGDTGWIYKTLVKQTPSVITKKGKCNIRSGPGTKNRIVFTSDRGIPFRVLSRKGQWIRVMHADGDKGWIYKSLVW